MKKFGVLLTSIIVANSLGITAFADTTATTLAASTAATSTNTTTPATTITEETAAQNAGITPDSIFYPIDTALDNLKIALTSSTVQKAQVELQVANERLSESIVMTFKDKPSLAAQAAQSYSTNISNAENILQTQLQSNTNTQTTTLEQQVATEEQNGTHALNYIENKVPEDTKKTISNIIQTQTVKVAAVQNMVQKLHALNDARRSYNKAEAALNKAQKSGDAAAITAATSTLTSTQTAYNQAKQDFVIAFQSKQAAVKGTNISSQNSGTADNFATAGTTSGTTQPNSTAGAASTSPIATSTHPESAVPATTQVTASVKINIANKHADNDESDDARKAIKYQEHGNFARAKSSKVNIHEEKK